MYKIMTVSIFQNKMETDAIVHHGTMAPWETVWIDWIDPYTVTDKLGNDRILNAMIFVDTAMG